MAVPWEDHPLAISGGELLAQRILPLLGHSARNIARAAAVCRGWRYACRAASPKMTMYRDGALVGLSWDQASSSAVTWSPCGKYIAAPLFIANGYQRRIVVWRASNFAVVFNRELDGSSSPRFDKIDHLAFSRNSALFAAVCGTKFVLWRVSDWALVAVATLNVPSRRSFLDIGVSGSPPRGLIGLASVDSLDVTLWASAVKVAVKVPAVAVLRLRTFRTIKIAPNILANYAHIDDYGPFGVSSFAISPDGAVFAATIQNNSDESLETLGVNNLPEIGSYVFVYEVAHGTLVGVYSAVGELQYHEVHIAWTPLGTLRMTWVGITERDLTYSDDDHVVCVWDYRSPAVPTQTIIPYIPHEYVVGWSACGGSYYVLISQEEDDVPSVIQERVTGDGTTRRAVTFPDDANYDVIVSPDGCAIAVVSGHRIVRVVLFSND